VNSRRRGARLLAIAVAAIVMGGTLGACSSDGSSKADVAAQDREVAAGNKADKQNFDKLKAALRVKWQARARARRAAAAVARRRRPRPAPARTVIVGGTRVSTVDVCAPIRRRYAGRAGRADRQWRLMQRKRALDFLNLSC